MARINIVVDDNMYLKIIKVKTELQNKYPKKIINFTDAVKHVLKKGLV